MDDSKACRHLLYTGHHPIRRARELEPRAPDAAAILVGLRVISHFRSLDITMLQVQVHSRLPWAFLVSPSPARELAGLVRCRACFGARAF